jgi:hypothetical protein
MIIALVAGIIFILLQAIFPDLPFSENQVLVFAGLIGAYILGEGLEGGRIADNLKLALKSHKFQALIAGLLMIAIKSFFPNFPLTEEQLIEIIAIFGALIIGAGVEGLFENLSTKG